MVDTKPHSIVLIYDDPFDKEFTPATESHLNLLSLLTDHFELPPAWICYATSHSMIFKSSYNINNHSLGDIRMKTKDLQLLSEVNPRWVTVTDHIKISLDFDYGYGD